MKLGDYDIFGDGRYGKREPENYDACHRTRATGSAFLTMTQHSP